MIQNRATYSLWLVILGIGLPACGQVEQASARIMTDPGQKNQEIQGFRLNYTGAP